MYSFERLIFFAIIPWVALATICDEKPSLIQCVALKYQFILPIKESCNPLRGECQTGDFIDPRVANCHLQLSGNTFHSLVNNFQLSSGYRCFPDVPEPDVFHKRNVGPSRGEPRCVPTDFKRSGSFLCGEHGTRCVCDAPKETGYGEQWWRNSCRCQYFVNLCHIPEVCAHGGRCNMWGSEVRCECPTSKKHCKRGINQCKANPGLCVDEGKICIELFDDNLSWSLGDEREGYGFACFPGQAVKSLGEVTHYCDVSTETFSRTGGVEPRNELDLCCYRMLTCAGGKSFPKKGNIFSYRPCYCVVEFRKCLLDVAAFDLKYKGKAEDIVKVLNRMTHCSIDDGENCDPLRSWTCNKGDLINPRIAHCVIDCKTGPLLPIWARACAIRQCKPPHHQDFLRIVDVARVEESSICKPVEKLPVVCGNRDTDTRCVCDGKPNRADFTDRCRCQYWPEQWGENNAAKEKKDKK